MPKGTGADSYRAEMPNGIRNFRNFQISRKKDNLERWTEIFKTILWKLSVPFEFEPKFLKILVKWNAPNSARSAEVAHQRQLSPTLLLDTMKIIYRPMPILVR